MRTLIILLVSAICLGGCVKTEEGENKRWQNNVSKLQTLALDYPAFKQVIDERIKSAEQMMTEAKSIADEEERVEAMSDANRALIPDYIRKLESVEHRIQELRELSRKAYKQANERVEEMLVDVATKQADKAIDDARARLHQPIVTNNAEAIRRVELALDDLDEAAATLKKIINETSEPEPVDTTSG